VSRSLPAALLSALALAHGACRSAEPATCPGERVATLHFETSPATDGSWSCPFAPTAETSFTATLAFDADSKAYLCTDRLEARPLQGTRDGSHIELAQQAASASVGSCACDLTVEESLTGELVLPADGSAASFRGRLRDHVKPSVDGASCELDASAGGAACGVPCDLVWDVTGNP
jgi:hypothetical protein